MHKVPDDLPKKGLFAEPIVVVSLDAKEVEHLDDGEVRVTFRAVVKDAEGRRCPDLAVEAEVEGPERTAAGEATTDLMGAILFRMTGPAGRYRIRIVHVSAGGLDLDEDASIMTAEVDAAARD